MKNKVLKLCKRLNKVTASEIAPILMLDEKEVSDILNELVNEDKLTVREDLIYFYKEVERKTPLPLFFEYREKEEIIGSDRMREVERIILLQCVDNHWIDHIDAMDQLRQGIGLRALGQQDPVIAYKLEGFNMFDEMVDQIRQDTVRYLFGITIEKQPTERKQIVDVDNIEAPTDEPKQPVVKETKVGRNDPCPCGSGKKYKNCCGKN